MHTLLADTYIRWYHYRHVREEFVDSSSMIRHNATRALLRSFQICSPGGYALGLSFSRFGIIASSTFVPVYSVSVGVGIFTCFLVA